MYNLTVSGRGVVPFMRTADNILAQASGTHGLLGIGFLLMIIVITFIVTKNYQNKKAALAATYFAMIMAVLFRYMGILTNLAMFISFALFIGALIWLYVQDD